MYGVIKDQLRTDLEQLKTEGLYKYESVLTTPQAAEIGVADESVLNLCANNYLGLADHPAMITAAQQALDRWGFGMASVRFICGTAEIHKELEASAGRVPRHRGRDLVRVLLRRQRRPVRDPARPRGRDHLRRAESRQHHRRRAAVQGGPLPVPEPGHGRSGGPAGGGGRGAVPDDRHRRGVLDGRLRRPARPHRRAGRSPRRVGHGRRLARRRFRGADRSRYPGTVRRPGPGGRGHRDPRQGAGWGIGRLHGRALGDGGHAAAAFPAVPVLELVGPLHRGGRHRHAWICWSPPAICWRRCGTTPPTSVGR